MDHDADAEAQIVLPVARDDEGLPVGKCADLLVASVNDVPIYLPGAYIKAVIQPYIQTAAKCHRKTSLVSMKIIHTKNDRQLRAVDIDLLLSKTEEHVPEWLEPRTVQGIVLEL